MPIAAPLRRSSLASAVPLLRGLVKFRFTNRLPLFTVTGSNPMQPMKVFLLLSAALCLFCAGCTNKYGDDPSNHGLPTPAATPVPIATPIEKSPGA